MTSVSTYVATYQSNGKDYDLYIAQPVKFTKTLPGIFVAPAWDGLNAPIKEITHRIAALGYVAVAVDVYGKGVRGDPTGDNSQLMNPLLESRGLLRDRLLAGYTAISQLEAVDSARIGAIGYCFGGLCVLDLARLAPVGLKAVVSFHGMLTGNDLSENGLIQASVLIEHGWGDPIAPPDDYLAFAREMDRRKADWQAHIHGGAVHAFTFEKANMPENGVQYHEAAARRSWKSMTELFDEAF